MISKRLEKLIFQTTFQKGNYTRLRKRDVKNILESHNLKFKYLNAIRNNHIMNHIIQRHHTIVKLKPEIEKLYKNGKTLLDLSQQYDFPLYGLAKILDITSIPDNMKEMDNYMNPDVGRIVNKKAQAFEQKLEAKLRKLGLKFKTQDDLIREGISPTPDFLLDQPYTLKDGTTIIWIDAKNMFGGDNWFTRSKLKKQNEKYIKHFGQGMFVFRYSYSKALKLKNCKLNDSKIENII